MTSAPRPAPSPPPPLPEKPLVLELQCSSCGAVSEHDARSAAIARHFHKGTLEGGWDGAALGRVFRCPGCGAVDQYTLTPQARLMLNALAGAKLLRIQAGEPEPGGPVTLGHFVLYDGTVARRPSQALAHLRSLAESSKGGEAWRRLGNLHERFFEPEAAELAWSRALEQDPAELEAAYSLATLHQQKGNRLEALRLAGEFLGRLPRSQSQHLRLEMCSQLADLLADLSQEGGEPRAVWLQWKTPKDEIASGRIDLEPNMDRDVLAVFLASSALLEARLVRRDPGLSPVPSGLLEAAKRVLGEGAPAAPTRKADKVGRNDPCPCGSGKKYKKCCGR